MEKNTNINIALKFFFLYYSLVTVLNIYLLQYNERLLILKALHDVVNSLILNFLLQALGLGNLKRNISIVFQ